MDEFLQNRNQQDFIVAYISTEEVFDIIKSRDVKQFRLIIIISKSSRIKDY